MNAAFILAVFAFLPLSALAAEPLTEGKDWRNCSTDAQCVLIQGKCGKTAVNAAFKSSAVAYYKQQAAQADCVKKFWEPEASEAQCRLESCSVAAKQKSK